MYGILLINKETDMTSRDVVNIVSKKLKIKKVGHAGTLDPLATGILVIGVGKGTKILDLLTLDEKEYIAEVKLGMLTDTLDITGEILKKEKEINITKEDVTSVLEKFVSEYMQEVPKYSAVKINGQKLYEYARNNEEIELPKRLVNIYELELIDFNLEERSFSFRARVSKGTYIRSLIRDIGVQLNIDCVMSNLVRIKSGKFKIEDSIMIDDIDENSFISIPEALDYPVRIINDELLKYVMNGNKIPYESDADRIIFCDSNNNLLAIYEKFDESHFKAFKVF